MWQQAEEAFRLSPNNFALNPPHLGLSSVVAVFACPADSRVLETQTTHRDLRVALTSYVGVLGTAYDRTEGVLFADSRIRLADIIDGTSNTLIAGERPPSPDFWYGWWYAGQGQNLTGSCDMVLGVRERNAQASFAESCPVGPYTYQPGRIDNQCDLFHFWSLHHGGANFLYADGSVHFLPYSADEVLPALATRGGGEVVDVP